MKNGVLLLTAAVFGSFGDSPAAGWGEGGPDRDWARARTAMVDRQIAGRGVRDSLVLEAMRRVPRHLFVPEPERAAAYEDRPLPIGEGQTISQPYIVALMSEALRLEGNERVLEIGTGSGYQTAVLCEIVTEVYSIEIVPVLAARAQETLEELGYSARLRTGDGYQGWPEAAPFDAILVTAAPEQVPEPLLDQLAIGGRLVIPVGPVDDQDLVCIFRTRAGYDRKVLAPVRFVPMTGTARNSEKKR